MSLDIIVDHTSGALAFKLSVYRDLTGVEVGHVERWLGVGAVSTPELRERVARSVLDELYGSPASLDDVVRVCEVLREAAER